MSLVRNVAAFLILAGLTLIPLKEARTGWGMGPGPGTVHSTGASCSFPTLPGLAGRWNALNVTTSSGNVTSATDLSGNGNNLTPSGGNVPLNATGYNGHPAFDFIAANNALLKATNVPMGTADTAYAFFVGQMKTNTAAFGGAVTYGVVGNDFNGAGGAAFWTRDNSNNGLANASAVFNPSNFAISLATNYRVGINLTTGGSGAQTYLNNVLQTTSGIVSIFSTNGTIVVGGRYIAGVPDATVAPWEGPIAEIVVGSGSLSGTNLNDLDAYFTCQHGTFLLKRDLDPAANDNDPMWLEKVA